MSSMPGFRRVQFIMFMAVRVTFPASMVVLVEQEETHDVESKTDTTNNQDKSRVCHFLNLEEALYSLQHNRDAKSDEEDSIDETTENLCTGPLEWRQS